MYPATVGGASLPREMPICCVLRCPKVIFETGLGEKARMLVLDWLQKPQNTLDKCNRKQKTSHTTNAGNPYHHDQLQSLIHIKRSVLSFLCPYPLNI